MRKHLTILFDAHPLLGKKTGVGYYETGLITGLAKEHPEVSFVGYYHNFLLRKKMPDLPQAPNISYRRIAFMPGQIVNALRRINLAPPIELLTFMRADFILYPNFLGAPSLFRTPSAPVIHDLAYIDHPEYASAKNARDLTKFVPATIKRAAFVITVSKFSKHRIIKQYSLANKDIVTTFIPPNTPIKLTPQKVKTLLKEQGITRPYVLFIGTLEPRKNLPGLMEAFRLLPANIKQRYSLVIGGKVDWKAENTLTKLQELQAEGCDILHTGYVSDETRAALYSGARLFVLPSFYEGFGMPILEAFSYGVPCAVSDIPPSHEVAGSMAQYFDPSNPYTIAEAIAKELGSAAPQPTTYTNYVAHLPSWEHEAGKVFDQIIKVIAKN